MSMKSRAAGKCVGAVVASMCACATGQDVGQGATIRSRSSDAVASIVELQSAKIVASGTTPLTLRMQGNGLYTGGKYSITVAKPGFPKRKVNVNLATVYGMGGLLAWIVVDPETGNVWQLEPHRSGLVWAPAPGEASFETVTGYVIVTLDDIKQSPKAMSALNEVGAAHTVPAAYKP
jgi:hypothetical protein